MTSFDPNTDYTLPVTEKTNTTDSLYDIIMDVQNTLQDISDLLLARDKIPQHDEMEQHAPRDQAELASVYDTIFK